MSVVLKIQNIYTYLITHFNTFLTKQPVFSKILKIFGCSAGLLLARKIWYISYHKYNKYPPGPVGIPFFGCVFGMADRNKFNKYIGESYEYAAMFPVGPKSNHIVINDMNLVLINFKNSAFNDRPYIMTKTVNNIPPPMAGINGKEWSERRKLFYNSLLKITNSKYMTTYVQNNIKNKIIVPSIEDVIKNNNGLWYPRESLFNYTFNTIFGACFGPKLVISLNDNNYQKFQYLSTKIFSNLLFVFILPIFSNIANDLFNKIIGSKEIATNHRSIISQWIEEAKKQKTNNCHETEDEFISYVKMMLNSNIDKKKAMSDIAMSFQVGTFTTAQSIELMLYNASKYAYIQDKIYCELRNIFNNSPDINVENMQQLNKAHYLRAFIEESWRHIGGRSLPRVLYKDYKLHFIDKNGNSDYYILPKGSSVAWNHTTAKNTKYGWKNADNFDVNNFLDENNKFAKGKDIKSKFSVFGYGQRQCPGISLAKKEVIFALAILFYKYKFYGLNGEHDTNFIVPYASGLRAKVLPLTVKIRYNK